MFREQQISIRMISEGSCDTKDWSNDAENSENSALTVISHSQYKNLTIFCKIHT